MSKETGIIMSGNHPKLILDGLKTQTRRVIIPQPIHIEVCGGEAILYKDHDNEIKWKYQVGGRLWVRETWAAEKRLDYLSPSELGSAADVALWYKADASQRSLLERGKWRPSLFMPRWASRILLEITEIRVERLREISEADAEAEGLNPAEYDNPNAYADLPCTNQFGKLWDSLNAKRGYGWETNPWVWRISFKRIEP
jgi:hypothetical protein